MHRLLLVGDRIIWDISSVEREQKKTLVKRSLPKIWLLHSFCLQDEQSNNS